MGKTYQSTHFIGWLSLTNEGISRSIFSQPSSVNEEKIIKCVHDK